MRVFRVISGAATLFWALALLCLVSPAHAEESCRQTVAAKKKKFHDVALIATDKEILDKCRNSTNTDDDKMTSRHTHGFCAGFWRDMRTAIETYLKAIGDACTRSLADAARCRSGGVDAIK